MKDCISLNDLYHFKSFQNIYINNIIPFNVRKRIYYKIMDSAGDPLKYLEILAGHSDYNLRVGDYRVIAGVDNSIRIMLIGHRRNVHK